MSGDKVFHREIVPPGVDAARITMTVNISQGRQLGFETMVDQTIANEDLDELLDRVTRSFNRAQALIERPELERHLRLTEDQLKKTVRDMAALPEEWRVRHEESGKRAEFRPNEAQRANLDQLQKQGEQLKLELELRREALRKCNAMIGHTDPELAITAVAAE